YVAPPSPPDAGLAEQAAADCDAHHAGQDRRTGTRPGLRIPALDAGRALHRARRAGRVPDCRWRAHDGTAGVCLARPGAGRGIEMVAAEAALAPPVRKPAGTTAGRLNNARCASAHAALLFDAQFPQLARNGIAADAQAAGRLYAAAPAGIQGALQQDALELTRQGCHHGRLAALQ